jgi:integrase
VPGPYPTVSLSAARQRAREIVAAAKRGEDLAEDERKRAAIAAATKSDTVANVAEEFIRRSLEGRGRAASYVSAIRRMFEEHMLPRWRARDIRSITRRDVVALLDSIIDDGKPVLANRVLAAVRAMFNWAIRRGIVDASPAALVERPAQEKARERTLSAEEITVLWPLFAGLGYPFGPFFQMALATGQRRDEVAQMRWADIDAQDRIWNLSGDQTKARRAHAVPLSPIAWEILMKAKDAARFSTEGSDTEAGQSAYVFTTTGDTPISGYGKAKARIDSMVAKALTEARLNPLAPWTIHDLRRTTASGLGKLGTSRFIISRVLNHADSSVTGIYDRHAYLAEKRHALESWGTYLGNLIQPPGTNVVELRAGA